ncbi:hypothetical protein [Streptomyces buecherae]|uniref:hypothetical protein n=1 Tax=Streptomyces buecherae TaxID=2763006 RepID=UPI003694241B
MPDASASRPGVPRPRPVSGALLLCRADPDDVRPSASLLPTPLLLAPAGAGWSVLLPAEPDRPVVEPGAATAGPGPARARPRVGPGVAALSRAGRGVVSAASSGAVARATGRAGVERRPVVADSTDLTDLARTVAAGEPWPVLGVWWGAEGAGFTVASGFRRPLTFVWPADGAPTGDAEAARALVSRLGLDPVLDGAAVDELTGAAPAHDGPRRTAADAAHADPDEEPVAAATRRLIGLVAVVSRAGLRLPPGLTPGAPEPRLRAAAQAAPGAETLVWRGWRDAVRAELDNLDGGSRGSWPCGPRARAVCAAQLVVGLPLAAWGLRRGRPRWALLGALLTADGAAGLARGGPRDG